MTSTTVLDPFLWEPLLHGADFQTLYVAVTDGLDQHPRTDSVFWRSMLLNGLAVRDEDGYPQPRVGIALSVRICELLNSTVIVKRGAEYRLLDTLTGDLSPRGD